MGVVKTSIFSIFDLFPEYREKIRHLFSTNSGFQALCQDFHQCEKALHYWNQCDKPEAPERRQEYMQLQSELEREIIGFLNEAR